MSDTEQVEEIVLDLNNATESFILVGVTSAGKYFCRSKGSIVDKYGLMRSYESVLDMEMVGFVRETPEPEPEEDECAPSSS